jgi:hypothetical protein
MPQDRSEDVVSAAEGTRRDWDAMRAKAREQIEAAWAVRVQMDAMLQARVEPVSGPTMSD